MGDPVDDYKKALSPKVDGWGKNNTDMGKQLKELNKQIDELEKIKNPSPDQAKKLKELTDKRKALGAQILKAATTLELDLLKVPPSKEYIDLKVPPPKKDSDNLLQVPGWLGKVIKDKGIPLGDDVTVVPNISVDIKHMKLKSAGITVKLKF